jgi:hypothetical protein
LETVALTVCGCSLEGKREGTYLWASVCLMRPSGEEMQETLRLGGSHNGRNGCYFVKVSNLRKPPKVSACHERRNILSS